MKKEKKKKKRNKIERLMERTNTRESGISRKVKSTKIIVSLSEQVQKLGLMEMF